MAHLPTLVPWTIGESETRIVIKAGKQTVAYVQIARNDYEVANLIAAAPDMLAVLKVADEILTGAVHPACRRPGDGIDQIRAVIAKATGGSV